MNVRDDPAPPGPLTIGIRCDIHRERMFPYRLFPSQRCRGVWPWFWGDPDIEHIRRRHITSDSYGFLPIIDPGHSMPGPRACGLFTIGEFDGTRPPRMTPFWAELFRRGNQGPNLAADNCMGGWIRESVWKRGYFSFHKREDAQGVPIAPPWMGVYSNYTLEFLVPDDAGCDCTCNSPCV